MKKSIWLLSLICFVFTFAAIAQVRPVEEADEKEVATATESDEKAKEKVEIKGSDLKNLPDNFKVKYQGGLFGFSKKQNGTIKFDDINERLIFFGKQGKERFSVPYDAILVIYPSQKKVRAGSGRVVGAAPIPGAGILGSLIKKRKNYMIIQFRDPDIKAEGKINFLLDTEAVLTSAINSLGKRAEMKQRGDAYMRSKDY